MEHGNGCPEKQILICRIISKVTFQFSRHMLPPLVNCIYQTINFIKRTFNGRNFSRGIVYLLLKKKWYISNACSKRAKTCICRKTYVTAILTIFHKNFLLLLYFRLAFVCFFIKKIRLTVLLVLQIQSIASIVILMRSEKY